MNNKKDLNDKLFDVVLDEALDLYAQDLANEECNPDMTDDEIKTMLEQKDLIYKKVTDVSSKHKYRFGVKRIILIAAVMVILMAVAVNASAIKTLIFRISPQISDTTLTLGTEQTGEYSYDQISEFENKKEIIIPKKLPQGMKISSISDTACFIDIQYKNGDKWVSLTESVITGEGDGVNIVIENNTYFIKDYTVMGMDAKIVKLITEINDEGFFCSWCSDKIIYELSTNCSEDELYEILSNLKYFYK